MNTPKYTPQVEELMQLVSPRVGLIRSLTRGARGPVEPNPPILYQAVLSHFDFKRAKLIERASAGKGETESEAIGGAIGEAVERYCASHLDIKSFRRGTWKDVGTDAVLPTDCVLYSERQYASRNLPYARWQEETTIDWLPVRELPSGKEALAPASLIYLSYHTERFEEHLAQITSSGLAAGPDLETAVRGGLYELIERDGFLIYWMNRLPAAEVDFAGAGGLAADIRAHYLRFGVQTRVFNITTDLPVYVMMAVSLNPAGKGPASMVALGCNPDPALALRKALLEICQIRPGNARRYQEEEPQKRLHKYEDVRTLEDHSAFFMVPEHLTELEFLLDNGRTQKLEDLPSYSHGSVKEDLDACVAALKTAGCRIVFADLTTPDLADFKIRVVRTIATGLQPIHFGNGHERLGGKRLYEVPRLLGFTDQATTETSLNPCPHPIA
jgi:ribosomal protein S12 methylthiotransferase accessory factor